MKKLMNNPFKVSPPLAVSPIFNWTVLSSCRSYEGDYNIISTVYLCKRYNKFLFYSLIYPCNESISRYFSSSERFSCRNCEDKKLCEGRDKEKLGFEIKSKKQLKHGILLYDETGITQETRIGRFVFKLKGKENGTE